MTPHLRRFVSVALLTTLLATACGSSDGTPVASADEASADRDSDPTAEASEAATSEPEPTAVPPAAGLVDPTLEPTRDDDGDATQVEAPREPADVLVDLARNVFNIDPDQASIACMVAEAETFPGLVEALGVGGSMDDLRLQQVTYTLNGCLQSIDLGAWATEAVGPRGEVRETAPQCFGDRFDDPERGDATFHTFAAITLQFRVDPDAVPDVTDALVTCTPISALGELFANQFENDSNFELEVDRGCLATALDGPGISETFWSAVIIGGSPPIDTIVEYLDGCSAGLHSDLAQGLPADFVPWAGDGSLASIVPSARANAYSAPPPMTIDPSRTYEAVMTTGGGQIRFRLFAETAPITVNSFVNLVRDGYYDGTVFHRVLADFMAQAGDPTASGLGGPGYQFADEVEDGPPLDRKGLLAMANTGADTNGSQFFITAGPTEWLNGLHTVFGEVISGQEIADAIELRDPDAPTGRGQLIESIVIIES